MDLDLDSVRWPAVCRIPKWDLIRRPASINRDRNEISGIAGRDVRYPPAVQSAVNPMRHLDLRRSHVNNRIPNPTARSCKGSRSRSRGRARESPCNSTLYHQDCILAVLSPSELLSGCRYVAASEDRPGNFGVERARGGGGAGGLRY
ncbi:uncharacterized protein A4U43_C07F1430 [Asparagus officinalis]|uniref:Uncharacterized protein n=1 Tax=Asparagus officinalis TaxID=4686 RepID=A0A5P1E8N7_ASPOF|nr:uncharacterized protein A4U43_C07F1430 [Asparagus officinalis]